MLTSVAAALRRRAVVLSSAAPTVSTFLGAGSSLSTAAASRHVAAPSAIAAHSWSSARAATLSVQQQQRRFLSTDGKPLFDKILVANRGEIACRVIRTARRLGIKSVAVYSDPDSHAVHVREADEAVCVGPAPSDASYLNVPAIMEAIRSTGAQAVHPGYGFLSENSAFASALDAEGIVFIGPGTYAIEKMGDKIESKIIAQEAGVNTIPGYVGTVDSDEEVIRISNDIGYPVMIKASAGGGGKGMRVAWNDKEALEGFRFSKDEALSSFGDDRIFIEKFIEEPRHIEIQVLADTHGNVIALPERECSIQRRNQKVIEESPSVLLDDETRRAMGEQACMLSKAVDYRSAGTVEFLCDKHKNFFFLEMNTRLQVEHPVSEYVTGIDLVEQMLRVAAGLPLPDHLLGGPVPFKGWSMEARVYAEDPFRNFLPSTGTLAKYIEPAAGGTGRVLQPRIVHLQSQQLLTGCTKTSAANPNVRVDAGVREGSSISMFYDPMICKLVTYGDTRDEALERLRVALDNYVIRGVQHNVPFVRDLCDHPRFIEGRLTTGFIDEEYPDGFQGVTLPPIDRQRLVAASAVMQTLRNERLASIEGASDQHQDRVSGAIESSEPLMVTLNEQADDKEVFSVSVDASKRGANTWSVRVVSEADGSESNIELDDFEWKLNGPLLRASIAGDLFVMQHLERTAEGFMLSLHGATVEVAVRDPAVHKLAAIMPPRTVPDFSNAVISPMPGTLVSVAVAPGDTVEEGQEVAVVEAMKMANMLRSPKKGVVKSVARVEGATLAVDDIIIEFEVDSAV